MSEENNKTGWLAVAAGVLQLVVMFFDRGRKRRGELEKLKGEINDAIDSDDTARLNLLLHRLRGY